MRAVSLVRYWLYGFRGFVVMTISLAIAFSVAVTGPPTDREIRLVTVAFDRAADAFGEDLEAAAIELCPQLPPEARVVCTSPAPPAPAQETATPATEEPQPVEVAATETLPPPPEVERTGETQLLGEPPAQRARPQRAQNERLANAQRATAERRTARAQPSRRTQRAQPQRPARTQVARSEPPAATPAPAVQRPVPPPPQARIGTDALITDEPSETDDAAYEEEPEYQDWRERRRERRRRRYEREYEPAPDEYEQEPRYRDEYYEEEAWPDDTH